MLCVQFHISDFKFLYVVIYGVQLVRTVFNPAGDQEKYSVAHCSNKNHNFANIGHKNMNDASF